jgi:hypothetical protein
MTFHDPQRQDEASRIRAQLEAIEIERLRLVARLREALAACGAPA